MTAPTTGGAGRSDLIEFIRRAGRTTRKAIAEHTGLSRSVVAQAVAELIAGGLVVERMSATAPAAEPPLRSRRGRPTSVLELTPRPGVVVACDIGHRHLSVAVCDLRSRVRHETRTVFAVDDGAAATFAALARLVAAALSAAGAGGADVRAFGVSFPYPVVRSTGAVQAPAALRGWQGVTATDARPAGFGGIPIVFDNDANFGAWGERIHGTAPALDNLLYVKLSDGIGAGLIVDGVLLSGARGTGGEMGHIQVEPGGALCRCGRRGCLETVVAANPPDHRGAGLRVGRAIAQLCRFVDAEVVVLGGQLGSAGGPLVQGVRDAFAEAFDEPTGVTVRTAALGPRSELVGIIDRTVTAAWAADHTGRATDSHSSWRRTNSRVLLEVPFEEERFVMKE